MSNKILNGQRQINLKSHLVHLSLTFDFDTLFLVMVSTNRTVGTIFSAIPLSL